MTTVSCPTCGRAVEWCEASRWRPFCTERCKLIDLGAWGSERNVIPGEPVSVDSGKSADRKLGPEE